MDENRTLVSTPWSEGRLPAVLILSGAGGLYRAWRSGVWDDFTWFLLALGVLALAIWVARVISPTRLALDARGFTWSSIGKRPCRYEWADLQRFGATRVGIASKVGFDYKPGRDPNPGTRALARQASGFDRSFMNVWPMSTQRLAELLNTYLGPSDEG